MAPIKLAVLASGRGSNLQAIIDAINSDHLLADIKVVISNYRDAAALTKAQEENIPGIFIDPKGFSSRGEFDAALGEEVEKHQVDLVVLAGFMHVLGPKFLDKFPLKVINIHPALLPSFPGVNGQKQALDYGVKIAGCTVHFVDLGVDTGPIIAQCAVPVLDDDTEESLSQRILQEEHKLYAQVIKWIGAGQVHVEGRQVKIQK